MERLELWLRGRSRWFRVGGGGVRPVSSCLRDDEECTATNTIGRSERV
jgi:hypothetical protein